MAGSILLIATVFTNVFWAAWMLTLKPGQLVPTNSDWSGSRRTLLLLTVPMLAVAGALLHAWGAQTVLLLGGSLAALAFLAFDRGSTFGGAAGATVLLAGGIAALLVGGVVLMPAAFFPAHAGRSMNLGFVAVVAGSLIGGSATGILMAKIGLRKMLLVMSMCSLIPAALAACTPGSSFTAHRPDVDATPLITSVRLTLQVLMAALCFPLTASLRPWVQRIAREPGQWTGSRTLLRAGYWLTFFGVLAVAACFLPARGEAVWLLVLTLVAAITFGNMLGVYTPFSGNVGLLLIAASCAPLVPTLLGLVVRSQTGNAGLAVGLVCAGGMLGNVVVQPWLDPSRPQWSNKTTLRGGLALTVLLLAPALAVAILG